MFDIQKLCNSANINSTQPDSVILIRISNLFINICQLADFFILPFTKFSQDWYSCYRLTNSRRLSRPSHTAVRVHSPRPGLDVSWQPSLRTQTAGSEIRTVDPRHCSWSLVHCNLPQSRSSLPPPRRLSVCFFSLSVSGYLKRFAQIWMKLYTGCKLGWEGSD